LLLISACSQSGPAPVANPGGPQDEPKIKPGPVALGALPGPLPEPLPLPQLPVSNYLDVNKQEKYEAALQDAFNLLEDRKYPETLAALEAARSFKDSDFVRGEIDKLRARLDAQAAAEKTVQDIQTVFDAGQSAAAAQLATQALQQYGATDVAP